MLRKGWRMYSTYTDYTKYMYMEVLNIPPMPQIYLTGQG